MGKSDNSQPERPLRKGFNPKTEPSQPSKPWEAEGVSERVPKSVLIKMPEPLKIKLDYVIDQTPGIKSQQKFLLEVIEAAIEKGLRNLDKRGV